MNIEKIAKSFDKKYSFKNFVTQLEPELEWVPGQNMSSDYISVCKISLYPKFLKYDDEFFKRYCNMKSTKFYSLIWKKKFYDKFEFSDGIFIIKRSRILNCWKEFDYYTSNEEKDIIFQEFLPIISEIIGPDIANIILQNCILND
jgi:hypothetical protein